VGAVAINLASRWIQYKGDCTYYSIPIGESKSEYAV
jgi:hypothetical protein